MIAGNEADARDSYHSDIAIEKPTIMEGKGAMAIWPDNPGKPVQMDTHAWWTLKIWSAR